MFHREMLASRSSSITYETIFARCDGSLYRCFVNRVLSFDQFNRLGQEHYTIHLNTVEDLIEVPRLEQSLPRQTPGISLEVDYPPEESSLELIES